MILESVTVLEKVDFSNLRKGLKKRYFFVCACQISETSYSMCVVTISISIFHYEFIVLK